MTDDAALLDWARAQAALGCPLTVVGADPGWVTTNAPLVLLRRSHVPIIEGQQRAVTALTALLGLPTKVVAPTEDGQVVADLTRAGDWLEALAQRDITPSRIATQAARCRRETPRVRLDAEMLTWAEATAVIGEDAAVWAALGSAQKAAPYALGARDVLASRRDDNPLATVRRAHAAAAVRLDQSDAKSTRPGRPLPHQAPSDEAACIVGEGIVAEGTGADRTAAEGAVEEGPIVENPVDAAADLRVALVLACQASVDTDRTGRTRPYVEAVRDVAGATLRHLERTTATRTNLPALRAARRVLHDALHAAGLAAPVPY